jgi:hypothetical protein
VARRFVVELLDPLAEVGLERLDAAVGEEGPHLALVGQHRLALDERRRAMRLQDLVDHLVVLGGVARPVHDHAVGGGVALELDEVVAEVAERVFLDRRRERSQLLPLGNRLRLDVALPAQVPQPLVVELGVVLRLDEARRRLGVVDAAHRGAPTLAARAAALPPEGTKPGLGRPGAGLIVMPPRLRLAPRRCPPKGAKPGLGRPGAGLMRRSRSAPARCAGT